MSIMQIVKDNPILTLIGTTSSMFAIIGAMFSIDSRYAHADEVQKDKVEIRRFIENTTQNLRKQMLEDKLFELDAKKAQSNNQRLSPTEQAIMDRYQRQLDELSQR